MQPKQSSQPRRLHHHAFEHSKYKAIMLHGSHRSTGQTTHCQDPGPASLNTSQRVQTHQNLFTLTKNISLLNKTKLGANIQPGRLLTFAGTEAERIETRISLYNQERSKKALLFVNKKKQKNFDLPRELAASLQNLR